MEIARLQEAVKAVLGMGPHTAVLAALAGDGAVANRVPNEFTSAARSLAARASDEADKKSVLRAKASPWI